MPILDVDIAARAGWTPLDLAKAYLSGGAMFLQIRAKTMAGGELLDLAARTVELARAGRATIIINDRADIARLAGAAGVHVGQADLAPADVRSIVSADAIVGLSTHTIVQLEAALHQPITYAAIGPVFATATKSTGYDAIGLDAVGAAAARASVSGIPLVAIGGITVDNASSVIAAGAASVAVIGDLLATGAPEQRTREFLSRLADSPKGMR
jgi:thiamine-phosphate pyrophosphorylase